jgi:hypothetical protein
MAIGAILLAGGIGAPTAEADVSLDEVILRQEQIRPVKDAILKRIDQWNGYAGMRTDPATRTIYVRWKGKASAEAREFLNSQQGRGARIVLETVDFTEAELKAESIRLVDSGVARLAELANDLSGLRVLLATGTRGVPESRVPVTLLPESAMPEPMGREDDQGAWHGGARTRGPNGGCTLGFAYFDGNGVYTSTANHCAFANGALFVDGQNDPIGRSERSRYEDDTTLIKVGSIGASGYLLDGYWNSTARPDRPIRGEANDPVFGEYVCQSGATSGEICGIRIKSWGTWFSRPGEETHGFKGDRLPLGGQSAARGDSGGPVYEQWKTKPDIWAVGLVSWGVGSATCLPGTMPGADCRQELWFTQVAEIKRERGLGLIVAP